MYHVNMIVDVTDLGVYRDSLGLLEEVYDFCRKLPASEKDTVSQIKRAAKSVSANISEGFAKRKSAKEFKRFLMIAMGSSDEVVTHLRNVYVTFIVFRDDAKILGVKYKTLSKRINKLHSSWFD